jgi:hypothetical protein
MQNFAVLRVTLFRKAKSDTMIGPEHFTLPVTAAIGGTSWAWKVMPTTGLSVTPSSSFMKSRCQ